MPDGGTSWRCYAPGKGWGDGGPLLLAHRVSLHIFTGYALADCWDKRHGGQFYRFEGRPEDVLKLAMRALVASHFGEEVEL